MRKTLVSLFAFFLFLTLPAFAQHGGGGGHGSGGGGSHGSSGGSHGASVPHASHGSAQSHNGGQRSGRQHGNAQREVPHQGYHYAHGGPARGHWDGSRFDRGYFGEHWGAYHPFYWGRCNWYGRPYWPGSYFWFGGAYFVIEDEIPVDWYDDEVYVDEYDGGYFLVNPLYPGVRFAVGVRF